MPKLQKNNTSGIIGVSQSVIKGRNYWVASYREHGTRKLKAKYFNVHKYGDTEAKKLAIAYREFAVNYVPKELTHGKDHCPEQAQAIQA